MFVVVAAIVGISMGVAKGKKNENLDELEGEMTEVEETGIGSTGGGGKVGVTSIGGVGGKGVAESSGGGGTEPLGAEEIMNIPPDQVSEYEKQMSYQSSVLKYKPLQFDRSDSWTGTTYADAIERCGQIFGYDLCPFEAICPAGNGEEPLGGFRNDPGPDGAWIPIAGGENDWVRVSNDSNRSRGGCLQSN
jgi:hypothetical protein